MKAIVMRLAAVLAAFVLVPGPTGAAPTPGPGPQNPCSGPPPGPGLPRITITSPAQGTIQQVGVATLIPVEGTVNVSPVVCAEVTVNGVAVPVALDGSFSTKVAFDWDPGPATAAPPVGTILPIVAEVRDVRVPAPTNPNAGYVARDRVSVIAGTGVHTQGKEMDALAIRVRKSMFDAAFAGVAGQLPTEIEENIQGDFDGNPYTAVGTVKDLAADGLGEYGAELVLHNGYAEVIFRFDLDIDLNFTYDVNVLGWDFGTGSCVADYDAFQGIIHLYFILDEFDGGIAVSSYGLHNYPTYEHLEVLLPDFTLDWVVCSHFQAEVAVIGKTDFVEAIALQTIRNKVEEMDVYQMIEDALAGVRVEDVLADALAPLGADVSTDLGFHIDPEGLVIDVDLGLGEPSDPEYLLGKDSFVPYHFAAGAMGQEHPDMPCGAQGCWYTSPVVGAPYDVGMSTSPYLFNWYLRAMAARGALDTTVYEIQAGGASIPLNAGIVGAFLLPGLIGQAPPEAELAIEVAATAAPFITGRQVSPERPPSPFAPATGTPALSRGRGGDPAGQFAPAPDPLPVQTAPSRVTSPVVDSGRLELIPDALLQAVFAEYELWVPDLRLRIVDVGYVDGWCGAEDGVYLELAVDARLGLSLDRKGTSLDVAVVPPSADDITLQVVRAPCGLEPTVLSQPNFRQLVAEQFAATLEGLELPGPFPIDVDLGGAPFALNDFLVHGAPLDLRPFVLFLGPPALAKVEGSGAVGGWAQAPQQGHAVAFQSGVALKSSK